MPEILIRRIIALRYSGKHKKLIINRMKKIKLIIFLLFLNIIQASVYAADESVFSGTIYDKEVKDIEGKEFKFRVSEAGITVDIEGAGVIVKTGGCKMRDSFSICVTNTSFAYKNITTYEDIYQAIIEIHVKKSALTLSKNIEKEEILIDEETNVEIILENTADIPAEQVKLTERYPNEIFVSSPEGCSVSFNTIKFEGQVGPNKIRSCKYKIKGLQPIIYESEIKISYFDGFEEKEISSTDTVTVLNYSLNVDFINEFDDITIGDEKNFSLILENINENGGISVTSFKLKIPDAFAIEQRPSDMKEKNNILTWTGKIEKNEKINLTGILTAKKSGSQIFEIDASYKAGKFSRKFNKKYRYTTDCNCPFFVYELGSNIPGKKTNFKVLIKNPNPLIFRNLKVDYDTNIPGIEDFSTVIEGVGGNSAVEILNAEIIIPEEKQEYYFNISASYRSYYNEFFTVKDVKYIPEEESGSQEKLNDTVIDEEVDVGAGSQAKENLSSQVEKESGQEKEPLILSKPKEKIEFSFITMASIAFAVIIVLVLLFLWILKWKKKPQIEIENIQEIERKL